MIFRRRRGFEGKRVDDGCCGVWEGREGKGISRRSREIVGKFPGNYFPGK